MHYVTFLLLPPYRIIIIKSCKSVQCSVQLKKADEIIKNAFAFYISITFIFIALRTLFVINKWCMICYVKNLLPMTLLHNKKLPKKRRRGRKNFFLLWMPCNWEKNVFVKLINTLAKRRERGGRKWIRQYFISVVKVFSSF